MTKKHFILLADFIKEVNNYRPENEHFNEMQINHLAGFCAESNPNFNRERWLSYIKGECGKNGGKVKANS